jgi:hypothetical protein
LNLIKTLESGSDESKLRPELIAQLNQYLADKFLNNHRPFLTDLSYLSTTLTDLSYLSTTSFHTLADLFPANLFLTNFSQPIFHTCHQLNSNWSHPVQLEQLQLEPPWPTHLNFNLREIFSQAY